MTVFHVNNVSLFFFARRLEYLFDFLQSIASAKRGRCLVVDPGGLRFEAVVAGGAVGPFAL